MKRSFFFLSAAVILSAAATSALAEQYTILTYNVGLLSVFGSDVVPLVKARGAAAPDLISRVAAGNNPHIILLQEIWQDSTALAIIKALAPLGYSAVQPKATGIAGLNSGLLLLVSPPLSILDWRFTPFTTTSFLDSFARKGILEAGILDMNSGVQFVIVGTHTMAVDTIAGKPRDKEQLRIIMAQVKQLLLTLSARSQNGALPGLLLGDFNVGPDYVDSVYQAILNGGLGESGATLPAAISLISWNPENPLIKYGSYPDEPPAKIDHVFYRNGGTSAWTVSEAKLVFTEAVDGITLIIEKGETAIPVPLSDHYGFLVKMDLLP